MGDKFSTVKHINIYIENYLNICYASADLKKISRLIMGLVILNFEGLIILFVSNFD